MRIVIEDGTQSWVQDVPDETDISIGRALTNTIIIEDTAASREHCVVQYGGEGQDDEYWLHDKGSRNGTRLNGRYVTKALVHPGDRIEIGTTAITFTGPGEEGAAQADEYGKHTTHEDDHQGGPPTLSPAQNVEHRISPECGTRPAPLMAMMYPGGRPAARWKAPEGGSSLEPPRADWYFGVWGAVPRKTL